MEPSSQRCLSPLPQAADPDQAARTSSASASPGALYRSFFAQECEAVASLLSSAVAAVGVPPRCASTIQEERLTPVEPSCSFWDSPGGGSPRRPASADAGPPDPFAAVPCSEQGPGPEGASPGVVAQPAVSSPISGLAGTPSWPEWEDSPQPSGANVTFECIGSGGAANSTYLCTGSPSAGEKGPATDAATAHPVLEVCERVLPIVTSTPLMAPPFSKEAPPTTLHAEGSLRREGSEQKPPADQHPEVGFGVTFISSSGSLPTAGRNGVDRVPKSSGKAPLAKRNLSLGTSRARGTLGIGDLSKGTALGRKIPQPAARNCAQNLVMPPARSGSSVQSQPVAQTLLPDEIAKTDLTKLPCNKKSPSSIQLPSKLAGRSGVQGSLVCPGLKLHSASRDDNASETRLPVFAGNRITTKRASQKRPRGKPSDKATASLLKQPFPKRSRLCKSQKEKPTCSDLMAVGETPSAAQEKELTAPCSQCQQLAEENQRLKSLLETCKKTVAFLKRKQTAVGNENCPPQTEAR